MLFPVARRFAFAASLAVVLIAPRASAQNPRADVKRFQWNPVVVHVGAEAQHGVELYMSVHTVAWALAWFDPDSLDAWLSRVRALESSSAVSDSTAWLPGRGSEERMRVLKGTVQGQQAYAFQLRANPSLDIVQAWLPAAYLADLTKGLEKAVAVARKVEHAPAIANAQPVHEQWAVDEEPKGAAEEHFGAELPQYALRGNVVVGFVVDSAGHVVPSTVTVYDCEDANIANRWQAVVAQWRFTPGTLGGHPVATRYRLAFSFDTGGSFHVGGDRIVPGRP